MLIVNLMTTIIPYIITNIQYNFHSLLCSVFFFSRLRLLSIPPLLMSPLSCYSYYLILAHLSSHLPSHFLPLPSAPFSTLNSSPHFSSPRLSTPHIPLLFSASHLIIFFKKMFFWTATECRSVRSSHHPSPPPPPERVSLTLRKTLKE